MSPPDSAAESETHVSSQASDAKGNGRDQMGSLGEALAGVSIGSTSSSGFGTGTMAPAPVPLAPGFSHDAWGNGFPESATAQVPFGGLAQPTEIHDPSAEAHLHHQNLGFFLPESPAPGFGEDVFKFSHSSSLPALGDGMDGAADVSGGFHLGNPTLPSGPSSKSYGQIGPAYEQRRRSESPLTGTTTGSSSRSNSPYAGNGDASGGGNRIPAYQRYDSAPLETRKQASFTEDDRSNSDFGMNRGNSHHSLSNSEGATRSPYGKNTQIKSVGSSGPYDQGAYDRSPGYQPAGLDMSSPSQPPLGVNTQQPQVLYMAVPSPDGRGQVLQPVQMVQLPGKPYTYMVPGPANLQADASPAPMGMQPLVPPSPTVAGGDYGMGVHENRGPSDNRVRDVGYPLDNNRQYGADGGLPRDEFGRGGAAGAGSFQPDPAVASLYSSQQRPPLDALLGQVRRLSRDQVGCRLVQQALDEEGAMAATLILNEGLPFWGEAMVDPFGNYLFQKILEKVTAEERIMLVKSVSTRLVNASLNLHGTRSVQKIVELCAQDEPADTTEHPGETAADVLTKSLSPAAARLCIDSHGNHVIQRILLKLGPKHSKFVFDAVAASVGDVARHRHGCCVIQRCLDSPPSEARAHLVGRIVDKSLELMQDAYGNYVVQYVLDVCSNDDVFAVCESVVGKVNLLAIQKFSSNVMEKCLERCSDRVKEMYLAEMSDPERIRELMMDPFGNYVVQRALSVATHAQAVRLVEAMRPHLIATQTGGPNGQRNGGVRNTAGGRRIIAKICRRFPNFTLNPVGSPDELYSQNKGGRHHHHRHHQGPMYSPVPPAGAPPPQHYPRVPQGHLAVQGQVPIGGQPQQQQQSYYSVGATPYYDPFAGHSGYPGM